ncbi:MAG: Type and secretion system protein [Chthoniobacteraceae bacterium]|nr:Type and secretion system protein [Chthoniobacteraceae bacterium]
MFRLTLALLLLASASRALAQITPPLPQGAPLTQPVSFGNNTPLPATVRLQYPNGDIQTILDLYEQLTRKRLIRPNNSLIGSVYIVVNDEVTREEAIKIIEVTLLVNGFALIPTEDPTIMKVFGNGANPRAVVPIISDEELLPEREEVVTFLFKLANADPADIQATVTQYIAGSSQGGTYSSVISLPKSQSLLVTETTPIIRTLIKMIRQIDLPAAEVKSYFIKLERADAKEVLDKLEKIFDKQPNSTGAPTGGTAPRVVRPATTPDGTPLPPGTTAEATGNNSIEINAGPTLTEDSIIVGKIKMSADIRTNRIHVVTRQRNIEFIRTLIAEFDKDVPFGEPTERSLKFVTASDMLEPVIKAIQDPGSKDDGGASGGQGTRGSQNSANRSTGSQGGFGSNNFGGSNGGFGGSSGGSGSGGFSEELQAKEVDTVPKAVTVGNTRIIADTQANKIIVIGNKEVKEKIFKLLDLLDVRPPQVMIHAVIGQLDLTDKDTFGLDYILHKGGGRLGSNSTITSTDNGTGTGTGTGTTTTVNNPVTFSGNSPVLNFGSLLNQRAITQIATAGAGGLSGFVAAGNSLDIVVNALQSTNRFHVVARPIIFASNNKKATIASGQEIAVPTQTLSSLTTGGVNTDNAAVSSSVGFKRVQLKLEVVPLINSDREVTLDIVQVIDEIVPGADQTVGGNKIPTIANRYVKSTVSMPNESTLVLGGLVRQANTKANGGIPYLSKIPVVGALFRSHSKDNSRSELVVLIRPVVSTNPGEIIQTREREQEFMAIEPDLEASIYPKGIRKRSDPLFRAPTAPILREKPAPSTYRK